MDILEQFGLTEEQAVLLFSMQRYLVQADIDAEENKTDKEKKLEWLHIWENGLEILLKEKNESVNLIKDEKELIEYSKKIISECGKVKIPLYLILLELSLFVPYFELEGFKLKFYQRISLDEKIGKLTLKILANLLHIDEEFVNKYRKSFKESVKSISGFYRKMLIGAGLGTVIIAITAGLATPFIAGFAAPAGLFGAAAINAGLAALGGGAVAAGGFGMAGGIAVIVGGGSIFGALSGGSIGAILGSSSDFALREGAKLEVILKEIILTTQKDTRFAQEMIKSQQEVIKKLESELSELKFKEKENKVRIKNLSKAIDYLRTSLKNSENTYKEYNKEYNKGTILK